MILSCREQENLVGDVSGDTSLIIGIMPDDERVSPEKSPTKFSCSRHEKIINNTLNFFDNPVIIPIQNLSKMVPLYKLSCIVLILPPKMIECFLNVLNKFFIKY